MLALIPALLLVLQTAAPAPASPPPDDAYLDATARDLVRLARERSQEADRSIAAYRTLGRERLSVGLSALRRERVLFRRELAARIFWRRDGVGSVEVLGARQVVPVVEPGADAPRQAAREAAQLSFDPGSTVLLRGLDESDSTSLRNPLSVGSEAFYRFATGDTTRIRLSQERVLRLVELRVTPRDPRRPGVQGSVWIDLDTHAAVRAVFRLNRPVDLKRDLGEDAGDIPGILQPIRMDLRYLTIDYGLWGGRWWLPRLVAMEGEARIGRMARLPVRYERGYEEFQVEGEEARGALSALADSLDSYVATAPADSAATQGRAAATAGVRRRCTGQTCWEYRLQRPADSVLVHSEHLPASIYAEGEMIVSEGELAELAQVLRVHFPGQSPWHMPVVEHSLLSPAMMRYNRVEGLSLAGRVDADFGPVEADATARIGTADREPSFEVGVDRQGFASRQRVAAYRRLRGVDPDPAAMGFGRSLAALLLGRDDADYFRALGLEATGAVQGETGWEARWRLFAERQSEAVKSTDFSLARLFGQSDGFVDNLAADGADQVGGALALEISRGLDPRGLRWRAEASLLASVGDFQFARPALTLGLGFPLGGGAMGALEAAGGAALGSPPVQSQWFLGGPGTVRGYDATSRVHGPTFWRARAEVARAMTVARLVAFSDAGWVGERNAALLAPQLLSAGVGVSVLDGLLRLDLARALRGQTGWRLDLHVDAPL